MTREERELIHEQIELARLLAGLVRRLGNLAEAFTNVLEGCDFPSGPRRHQATRAVLTMGLITNQDTGAIMATTLPDDSQFTVSVAYVDRRGNPATVDSVPVWATDHPELLTIDPADDGMSALVAAAGPTGSAQVTVTADAAFGPDVRDIIGILDVSIVGAEAVSATLSAGAIEPQP